MFIVAFVLAMLIGVPAMGQTLADLSGEVKDTTGAVIPGATVTLTNVDTGAVRSVVTNDAGAYSFPALVPGPYSLRVERQGFKTVTRPRIELQVQQDARVDVELPIGQVSEAIEVSGSAALLSTENATVGTVIENKRIVELPLNGRNYLQLVSLAPNVSYGFASAGQAGSRQGGERSNQNISVSGQRSYFNNFTLDGVNNTDPNFNSYVIQPSIDALQEFKVQTGVYPAEFGRQATQINVSTKPGTNDYHGTLFEFLRNDYFDAKNYQFSTVSTPKDPFKWNQYGFTLGGPVWIPKLFNGKNKLFFMGNYESFRERRSGQATYNVPSAAMRTGNFSELLSRNVVIYDPNTRVVSGTTVTATPFNGNIIPDNRISPFAKKLLEFYPAPNVNNGTLTRNFQQGQGAPRNKDQFVLRMDFNESSNSQWAGRYSWGDENQLNQGLRFNGFQVLTNVEQYMGSNTRLITPTLVNEARYGQTRFFNSAGRELAFKRDVVTELGVPGLKGGDPVTWGIPSISLTNYSGFGDDSEGPYANDNGSIQFVDNVSWIKGKHSFRFGGEYRRDRYNQVGNQFARGSFFFDVDATTVTTGGAKTGGDAFADFLLGNVRRAEAAVSIASAQFRSNSFAVYIDDVWKITPTVTFNYGLRYERTPPWEDQTGRLVTVALPFMDSTPRVADKSRHPFFLRQGSGDFYEGFNVVWPDIMTKRDGSLGNRLVKVDNNDFAPRLGLTWSPNSKWVVRTGAGMFYSQDTGNPRFDMARNLAGRTRFESGAEKLYTFENSFTGLVGAKANVFRPYAFANLYDRRTPYTMQWLFNIQRELPGNTLFEVGYIGSVSHHLESLRAVNEEIPGTTAHLDRTPYVEFGRIQLVDNGGNANYNGLGMKLTKRYSAGLTYLVSYTWSKSIDNASAIRNQGNDTLFPQNSYCMRCERSLSAFHTAHRFVTSALYELPIGRGRAVDLQNGFANALIGGWQIGSIITAQTGFPMTPSIGGRDQSNTGAGFDRPIATGEDPNLPSDQRTTQRWYNPGAYRIAPFGSFGNVARTSLIGPNIFAWDASLHKDFRFTERQSLQFRWEMFNAPNHPNWGDPNMDVCAGAPTVADCGTPKAVRAGQINNTRTSMRQQQFALKYIF